MGGGKNCWENPGLGGLEAAAWGIAGNQPRHLFRGAARVPLPLTHTPHEQFRDRPCPLKHARAVRWPASTTSSTFTTSLTAPTSRPTRTTRACATWRWRRCRPRQG